MLHHPLANAFTFVQKRMKTQLLIASLALLMYACSGQSAEAQKQTLSAEQAAQLIKDRPELQVVDVRTPQEAAQGTLPGAANMNFYASDFKDQISKLDKEKPVLLYCLKGVRSSRAAQVLDAEGFKKIYDLQGGFAAWQNSGQQVEKQ